ncbi:MAG: ribonuclease H-like domain-containing protein [Tissierellia bacterium]|nr:ribonuclease H-like domain-containing protein [Tissierellia bacterium]
MIENKQLIVVNNLQPNDIVLDIETTGLYANRHQITVLSFIRAIDDASYQLEQYLAESVSEEREILIYLQDILMEDARLITYNGVRFDLPFINTRAHHHRLAGVEAMSHLDLYLYLRTFGKLVNRPSMGQKALEIEMGIQRPFEMDGADAVEAYQRFKDYKDRQSADLLLEYNSYDVVYLEQLLSLHRDIEEKRSVEAVLSAGDFSARINSILRNRDVFMIHFEISSNPYEIEVNLAKDNYQLKLSEESGSLSIVTKSGYISPGVMGSVFAVEGLGEPLIDASSFDIMPGYLVIARDKELVLNNIKQVLSACLLQLNEIS